MEKKNEMMEKIKNGNILGLMAEVLKDNKFEFEHKEKTYRVRQPNPKEKQNAYQQSMLKNIKLMENPDYKTADQLKEMHKKRGVDIGSMETKLIALEKEKEKFELQLAEMVLKEASETERKGIEKKIISLTTEITQLRMKKLNLLKFSIESLTNEFYINYLTSFLLERKIEKKIEEKDKVVVSWKRVYDSFEKFEIGDENLVSLAVFHSSLLVNKDAFGK